MTDRQYQIMSTDSRLGRHVNHDSRSKDFPAATAPWASVNHAHHGAVLDQGQLGSCTGNASADALNIDPTIGPGPIRTEVDALAIYSLATQLDSFPGQYPPTDTGSDGLSACKAMQEKGWISGYTHAFGIDHMVGALMLRPVMCGTVWLADMFNPDPDGRVHPTGAVKGGHEYTAFALDIVRYWVAPKWVDRGKSRIWFINSWGSSWGAAGCFYVTIKDFTALLNNHGDVIVPVK